MSTVQENSLFTESIDGQIASIKEMVVEDSLLGSDCNTKDLSLGEKARDLGAFLAHQTLDGVGALTAIVPEAIEEARNIGSTFSPEGLRQSDDNLFVSGSPVENWDKLVYSGHEKIDQLFSTNQAQRYSPEAKEANDKFVVGLLPLPGTCFNAKTYTEAGKAFNRAGFTRAERGLMKHGYREDSVFPKPVGNPAQVNAHGQAILEEILNDPHKKVYQLPNGNVKVFSLNGRGAHFKNDNTFVGFIEEQYEKEINH